MFFFSICVWIESEHTEKSAQNAIDIIVYNAHHEQTKNWAIVLFVHKKSEV